MWRFPQNLLLKWICMIHLYGHGKKKIPRSILAKNHVESRYSNHRLSPRHMSVKLVWTGQATSLQSFDTLPGSKSLTGDDGLKMLFVHHKHSRYLLRTHCKRRRSRGGRSRCHVTLRAAPRKLHTTSARYIAPLTGNLYHAFSFVPMTTAHVALKHGAQNCCYLNDSRLYKVI